ncbi:MAG TPA: hypothetical protein VEA58_02240 [Anaerovoracaceae bacterium]|nr:hypothetical protein [Anaerovoracaceae bacterium]
MNKRMKVTIFATCALLICLNATSVFAVNVFSTAWVDLGVTNWVTGGSQVLNNLGLSGTVASGANSIGLNTQTLRGEMWTKGCCFDVQRSFTEVAPKASANMPAWGNPNQETGTFYAKGRAQFGNHVGFSQVSQAGH